MCVFTVHESGVSVNKTITVLPVCHRCTVPITITCCTVVASCYFTLATIESSKSLHPHMNHPPCFSVHFVSNDDSEVLQPLQTDKEGSTHNVLALDGGAINADEACDFTAY